MSELQKATLKFNPLYVIGFSLVSAIAFYLPSLPLYLFLLLSIFLAGLFGQTGKSLFHALVLNMLAPFNSFAADLSPLFSAAPQVVFITGYLLRAVSMQTKQPVSFKVSKVEVYGILGLAAFPLIATLASGFYDYFHLIVLYWINLTFVLFVASELRKNPSCWQWVWGALIGGPIVALALLTAINGGDATFSRLSLAGNVRIIANPLGPAILLLVLSVFSMREGSTSEITFFKWRFLDLLILAVFIIALVATASRGVMLAIGLSLLGVFFINSLIFSLPPYRKTRSLGGIGKRQKRGLGIAGIILVVIGGALIGRKYLNLTAITDRLSMDVLDDGRLVIWISRLREMDLINWMFGAGINRFPSYSETYSGMYAHSVYIDFLVSFGVFGILLLLIWVCVSLWRNLKRQSIVGIALSIYLVISFSLHGSITTSSFWILLAIISSLPGRTQKLGAQICGTDGELSSPAHNCPSL